MFCSPLIEGWRRRRSISASGLSSSHKSLLVAAMPRWDLRGENLLQIRG